jgi:hypothetical protein
VNHRRRRLVLAALCGLGARTGAAAAPNPPAEVRTEGLDGRLVGSGTLRFLGFQVYAARLWAGPAGLGADWGQAPFALELQYDRKLLGQDICERSLSEMRRVDDVPAATSARWLTQLRALVPDVEAGDRITGIHRPAQGTRFYSNAALTGTLGDASFARPFFGIWLSPRTSEPALRKALLGSAA